MEEKIMFKIPILFTSALLNLCPYIERIVFLNTSIYLHFLLNINRILAEFQVAETSHVFNFKSSPYHDFGS